MSQYIHFVRKQTFTDELLNQTLEAIETAGKIIKEKALIAFIS